MIETIILTSKEFKDLELKYVGTYGKGFIYKNENIKECYLLQKELNKDNEIQYEGMKITYHRDKFANFDKERK